VPSRRDRALLATGAAIGAGAAVAGWAALVEPRRTIVERITLELPGWPPALDGLQVALVSDLHAGGPHVDVARLRRLVTGLNTRWPDLVLLAGDLVDADVAGGEPIPPEPVAEALGRLRPPFGAIAVLGNHDRAFDGPRVAAALRAAGVVVLDDDLWAVGVRGVRLWIAGVADVTTERADPDALLARVPDGDPVLVLTHNPDVFPRVPPRAALVLAGHTHGGQVALPGVKARVIPSRFGARYAAGHVVEGDRHLFVTSGVGESRWPIRLNAPPEVVLLRLRPLSSA
jgi:predicted MPP superfamily phosphohydrolase